MENQEVTNQENTETIETTDQDLAKKYPDCFQVDKENSGQLIRLVGVFGKRVEIPKSKPYKWISPPTSATPRKVKKIHPITGVEFEVLETAKTEYWLQWAGMENEISKMECSGTLPATTEYQRDQIVKELTPLADERARANSESVGYVDALRVMSVYHGIARRLHTTTKEMNEIKKSVPRSLRADFDSVIDAIELIQDSISTVDQMIPYSAVCEAYIATEDRKKTDTEIKKRSIPITQ